MPLILGKSVAPRCFKHVDLASIGVIYKHNKNAWMTTSILKEYHIIINEELIKKGRKILILMDNCPAHNNLGNFSNIKIAFLPHNTTSLIQPLDQGIIRALKANYRRFFINNIFCSNNPKKFKKI